MNGKTNVTVGPNTDVMEVPLDPVTGFVAKPGNGKVEIMWTDPKDKYATPEGEAMEDSDQLVSKWTYTKLIRKENVAPIGPNDGTEIVSSQVRNEYQTTPYTDTSIENGHSYYYAVIAYNEQDVPSEIVVSDETVPKLVSSVLNENTWDVIDMIASQGLAQSYWEIGDETAEFIVCDETHTAVILDFNHDDLADGSGKAAITFSLKGLMNEKKQMNSSNITSSNWSYPKSSNVLYPYLENTVYNGLATDLQSILEKVTKVYGYDDSHYADTTHGSNTLNTYIFPFSVKEAGGDIGGGKSNISPADISDGYTYPYFSTAENRIKYLTSGEAYSWWLGSGRVYKHYSSTSLQQRAVSNTGDPDYSYNYTMGIPPTEELGVCFGFCIGKSTA